jgi:hypothetical protein
MNIKKRTWITFIFVMIVASEVVQAIAKHFFALLVGSGLWPPDLTLLYVFLLMSIITCGALIIFSITRINSLRTPRGFVLLVVLLTVALFINYGIFVALKEIF